MRPANRKIERFRDRGGCLVPKGRGGDPIHPTVLVTDNKPSIGPHRHRDPGSLRFRHRVELLEGKSLRDLVVSGHLLRLLGLPGYTGICPSEDWTPRGHSHLSVNRRLHPL